jgi:hypothetical protein
VNMPPNTTETIECSLWVGDGENHFDACTVTVEESIEFAAGPSGIGGIDQASILSAMILYAQSRGYWGALAYGEKSNLHVNTMMPATGIMKLRVYQLANHQKVYDGGGGYGVCDEFLQASDGLDWRMECTPTSKTLVSYYPKYAPVRADLPLIYVRNLDSPAVDAQEGIDSWTYGDSIEPSANQIVIEGGWDTSAADAFASREEGGYNNPASLGGLTLELVDVAPNGSPISELQSIASGRGAQLQDPVITPTFVLVEPKDTSGNVLKQYIGVLTPGVIVPLNVQDGTLVLQGNASIATVALDCVTEELSITVDG